ncbi:MAG TPA: hypothetical protein VHU86_08685 [Solirubrobacterales bacterium]|jgi:hypothetical protein|nr:hypothetical protein [Solirubrobacterales bacterium]
MSAFVVDPTHIDVMLSVALHGPSDAAGSRHEWFTPYLESTGARLSSVACSPLGAALLAECIASVSYRYPDDTFERLPGPVPVPRPEQYEFTDFGSCMTIAEACKAIDCYEYQSCEHPDWKESVACGFCGQLRQILTTRLPGAFEAPWEWTSETLAGRGLIPAVAVPVFGRD